MEGAQKTEGKRKGLKKLGGDMEKMKKKDQVIPTVRLAVLTMFIDIKGRKYESERYF